MFYLTEKLHISKHVFILKLAKRLTNGLSYYSLIAYYIVSDFI